MKKNRDEDIIRAAKHFSIAECGQLSRDSTPYPMTAQARMGVGFDYFDKFYAQFHHRHEKSGKSFKIYSHRMVYYLQYGELPEFIDHIDGDSSNNSISNLRAATRSQNMRNRKSDKNSSSMYLGVGWVKAGAKWVARIKIEGKVKHLGYFTDEQEAARVYNKEASEYFGEFANLNEI
tara:strand:+ start:590 stop:1120 length:531 start_codon:yes stop_codon:yes gene_type:complete